METITDIVEMSCFLSLMFRSQPLNQMNQISYHKYWAVLEAPTVCSNKCFHEYYYSSFLCTCVSTAGTRLNLEGLHNLAIRKKTAQKSQIIDGSSDRAVDGNRINKGSCTTSEREKHPWWAVDLKAAHFISNVVITNRRDLFGMY